jgi:hypothetical protein
VLLLLLPVTLAGHSSSSQVRERERERERERDDQGFFFLPPAVFSPAFTDGARKIPAALQLCQ